MIFLIVIIITLILLIVSEVMRKKSRYKYSIIDTRDNRTIKCYTDLHIAIRELTYFNSLYKDNPPFYIKDYNNPI